MIDSLGRHDEAALLLKAIEAVTRDGAMLIPDFGGTATPHEVGEAVRAAVRRLGS